MGMRMKMTMTPKEILGLIIQGLKNGRVEPTLVVAQQWYDQMPDDAETFFPPKACEAEEAGTSND